jgi:hypothetical protein
MHITWTKAVTALIAIPALAVAAGCSSSSTSSVKPTKPAVTKPAATASTETITGNLAGTKALAKSPEVPLTYTGPVNTTGTFNLGNGPGSQPATGQHRAFVTKAGTFEAVVTSVPAAGATPVVLSKAVCEVRSTTVVDFSVPASAKNTGAFKGVTGSNGQVTVVFQGDMPKLKSGKCNLSQNAEPSVASVYIDFNGHVAFTFPAKK